MSGVELVLGAVPGVAVVLEPVAPDGVVEDCPAVPVADWSGVVLVLGVVADGVVLVEPVVED